MIYLRITEIKRDFIPNLQHYTALQSWYFQTDLQEALWGMLINFFHICVVWQIWNILNVWKVRLENKVTTSYTPVKWRVKTTAPEIVLVFLHLHTNTFFLLEADLCWKAVPHNLNIFTCPSQSHTFLCTRWAHTLCRERASIGNQTAINCQCYTLDYRTTPPTRWDLNANQTQTTI